MANSVLIKHLKKLIQGWFHHFFSPSLSLSYSVFNRFFIFSIFVKFFFIIGDFFFFCFFFIIGDFFFRLFFNRFIFLNCFTFSQNTSIFAIISLKKKLKTSFKQKFIHYCSREFLRWGKSTKMLNLIASILKMHKFCIALHFRWMRNEVNFSFGKTFI